MVTSVPNASSGFATTSVDTACAAAVLNKLFNILYTSFYLTKRIFKLKTDLYTKI
jgi:hypothetical protein